MQSAPLSRHWPTLILGTTALVAAALAANSARGQENTSTTILVTASVEAACSLQTDQITLDFGLYEDVQIPKTASFTYNCPAGKDITFNLNGGQAPDGSGVRPLPNTSAPGTTPLNYEIFRPGGGVWLDNHNISSTPGGDQLVSFDASLHGGQLGSVNPGLFSDTLTLTLVVN